MADDPNSGASFSQEDIDALLGGGGGEDAPAEPAPAPEAKAEEPTAGGAAAVDQAEIDALLNNMGGGESAGAGGESAGDAAAGEVAAGDAGDGSDFDQNDIDALLAQAGAGADAIEAAAPEPEPAPADDRLDSMGRPFDDAAAAMAAAIEEERQAAAAAAAAQPAAPAMPATPLAVSQFDLPEFTDGVPAGVDPKRVSMLNDVDLRVKVELGRTQMLVEDVLKLDVGSVVELDKLAGDPVDVYVNDRLVARGEVLVLNDSFCVRVSEVNTEDPHRVAT